MDLVIVAAHSENRVIGRAGGLPWRLPEDLKRFKAMTLEHTVIMGRRTWDSLPGALPKRRTIVLTRDRDFRADGAEVVHDFDDAVECARATGSDPTFVLGGGAIYALALPVATRMELTVVHAEVEGDAFFPEYDPREWWLVRDERHEADERHALAFSFRTYDRA